MNTDTQLEVGSAVKYSLSCFLSLSVAWRGYLGRRHVKRIRQDRENAAVQIQSGNDLRSE